jgi:hypothetical protein
MVLTSFGMCGRDGREGVVVGLNCGDRGNGSG